MKTNDEIGIPFMIDLDITADTVDNTFTLRSTNYDWNGDGAAETAPFKDYRLVITGIDFEIGTITGTASLKVDNKLIYSETASSAAISEHFDGTSKGSSAPNYPKVSDIFGKNLDCYGNITVSKSAAPGATSTCRFYGYAVPNTL